MREAGNLLAQRLEIGQFLLGMIGEDECAKDVGRTHRDLGDDGCVRLEGENVFEFVGEFAEFAIAAGGRIPLQGVHYAAQAARSFCVGRIFFEMKSFFIQLFDEFSRSLEEEFAKVAHPVILLAIPSVIGRSAHALTSIRL